MKLRFLEQCMIWLKIKEDQTLQESQEGLVWLLQPPLPATGVSRAAVKFESILIAAYIHYVKEENVEHASGLRHT